MLRLCVLQVFVLFCVFLRPGHFVMVPLNLICQQNSFFEHSLNLWYVIQTWLFCQFRTVTWLRFKFDQLTYWQTVCWNGLSLSNQKTESLGSYVQIKCILSEHRTLFQAFWRYINETGINLIAIVFASSERAITMWTMNGMATSMVSLCVLYSINTNKHV